MTNTTNLKEEERARHRLACLSDWSTEQLEEEFSQWPQEEITKLWELLEPSFRNMCRGFGMATPTQRVSTRGRYTHRQIQRLTVLQKHAIGVSN